MTKMTYVQAIDNAINGILDDETMEKLTALKTQLAKRNSGERKMSKTQVANESLKTEIADFLRTANGLRAGDVAEHFGISGQKASALLTQLVKAEIVEKWTEKRVTYFKAVDTDKAQFLDGEVSF